MRCAAALADGDPSARVASARSAGEARPPPALVRALAAARADVNEREAGPGADTEGYTPLHHLEVVGAAHARELLRAGAAPRAAARADGPTPRSLARGRAVRRSGLEQWRTVRQAVAVVRRAAELVLEAQLHRPQ